ELARATLGEALRDLAPETQVGLVAYGSDRKGDCQDIEVVAPLGSDRPAVEQAMNGLRPMGSTPLAAAIRKVAHELQPHPGEATVVLVSDGEDSCGGDPCAATREARAAGVNVRYNVLAFATTEAETARLQCVAREGGGRYFTIANRAELPAALAEVP